MAKKKPAQKVAIDYSKAVNDLKQSEPNIDSVAIVEGKDDLAFSTENWDISNELSKILSIWDSLSGISITISDKKYSILQSTPERLVATSIQGEGHIIGAKDDERKVISHIKKQGKMLTAYTATARALKLMSSKEAYLADDAKLGKEGAQQLTKYWDLPKLREELMNGLIDFFKKGAKLERPDDFDIKRREKDRKKRMDELEKVLRALAITEEDRHVNMTITAEFTTDYIYDDFHLLRIKHKIINLLKEEFQTDNLELKITKNL